MDIGVLLGPSLIALLCMPAAYALRAPAWSAGLLAGVMIGGASSIEGAVFSTPIAVLVCTYAEKWVFNGVLRVQIVAVALLMLSLTGSAQWGIFPLAAGYALGVFYDRSLKNSLLLFRATALTLMVLIVAIHPGFWGQVRGSRAIFLDYLAPAMAMILFAITTQIGSGVLKRAREADRGRLFIVAEREIAGLMDRLTPKDSQPA